MSDSQEIKVGSRWRVRSGERLVVIAVIIRPSDGAEFIEYEYEHGFVGTIHREHFLDVCRPEEDVEEEL